MSQVRLCYEGALKIERGYWKRYGGWSAFLCSAYFHLSLFLSLCAAVLAPSFAWWNTAIDIIPSMLGFSLAGYAILVAFGAGPFQEFLARAGGQERSVLGSMSAAFVHFVVIQVAALVVATVVLATSDSLKEAWTILRAYLSPPVAKVIRISWSTAGFLSIVYPIITAAGATFWVFSQVEVFIRYAHLLKNKKSSAAPTAHQDKSS
jgi:hypothetical protein